MSGILSLHPVSREALPLYEGREAFHQGASCFCFQLPSTLHHPAASAWKSGHTTCWGDSTWRWLGSAVFGGDREQRWEDPQWDVKLRSPGGRMGEGAKSGLRAIVCRDLLSSMVGLVCWYTSYEISGLVTPKVRSSFGCVPTEVSAHIRVFKPTFSMPKPKFSYTM